MQFHTDDYFHIGHDHAVQGKPCQDYALSGVMEGAAFAIVADGCSTGGLTDVGARFMSLSSATAIREHWGRTGNVSAEDVAKTVNVDQRIILGGITETLRLTRSDMLATCVYAYIGGNEGFVHVRGDGVVAVVSIDGQIQFFRFDWENNTPFYPAYSDDDYQSFIFAHGGDPFRKSLTLHSGVISPDGESQDFSDLGFTIAAGIDGITIPIRVDQFEQLAYVAVFTDGVTQVDGLDWKEAVRNLLAFKSVEGAFAKRRMIRFVKEAGKYGTGPLDDIAYAVIRVRPTPDTKEEDTTDAS